jgi:hypothetical protein
MGIRDFNLGSGCATSDAVSSSQWIGLNEARIETLTFLNVQAEAPAVEVSLAPSLVVFSTAKTRVTPTPRTRDIDMYTYYPRTRTKVMKRRVDYLAREGTWQAIRPRIRWTIG